ncbi:MAG: DUF2723 domain-containing protein [Prevotellaceae bacterium]|jgi:hypothetical protein|nr:DUF2723 domain-containing protein [Prevotellaceae bacterium]
MKNFKLFDILFGWIAFAIAAITYLLTIEPTVSLWDCGEFISSAYKLEVGHPPGAPLFAMIGRIFSLFAPSVDKVAMMLNSMSALASAFTILFLFWSITHLMKKYFGKKNNELTLSEAIVTLGCGMIGALAYTFSDSFWFSAVEAEVYATSSLFTAVTFWAALKWEEVADTKYANRWLILIAYLTGLSIGVHLLNLLVIPAIVMIYYFKKYTTTVKGVVMSIITGGLILVAVLYIIVPWVPRIAFWFDFLFVNELGLPINSGTLFFLTAFAAMLSYLIYYTYKKGKALANTIVICVAVISIGFSSYAMILIRSSANTPMEQNNPDNIRTLMSYLNREQYGDWPLFSGPYYNAPITGMDVDNVYVKNQDKYEQLQEIPKYIYDKRFTTIFPRMHSRDAQHIDAYKEWGNVKGRPVAVAANTGRGNGSTIEMVPTFGENLRFLFSYQIGWMYWRYFMWNFAGRQNDYQGDGNCLRGNWISGFNFIDARLGPQDELPDFLANNKARNKYYMLPFLLGILGVMVHWARNKKDFSIVLMLFFLTGIAIVIYLNQSPYQPRERDYAYVGSFYAFAIWIGIGVAGLYELIRKLSPKTIAASLSIILSISVPYIMAKENWDDHDRSGRYIAADFGKNYLESCDKNGVVFTYGDNDTFCPWYSQEVEGNRTDVRVVNTSYLSSDWYYEQLLHTYYDSHALKLTATPDKIIASVRNIIPVKSDANSTWELKEALAIVMSDDIRAKTMTNYSNKPINYFPAKTMKLTVDKNKVRKSGIVKDSISDDMIYDQLTVNLPQNGVQKNTLAILDIIANNFDERPIYFGKTIPQEFVNLLKNNIKSVGLAYLITPEKLTQETSFDIEKSYDLFMNKYQYRGLNDPNVYWDDVANRTTTWYRQGFIDLINALMRKNDRERAKAVLDKMDEVLPLPPKMYGGNEYATIYFRYIVGDTVQANEQLEKRFNTVEKELEYFAHLDIEKQVGISNDIADNINSMKNFVMLASMYNKEAETKLTDKLNFYKKTFPDIVKAYNIR